MCGARSPWSRREDVLLLSEVGRRILTKIYDYLYIFYASATLKSPSSERLNVLYSSIVLVNINI